MPIIEWSDTYLLGIEQIDEHHRHLLTLLNSTYDLFVGHGQKVEVEKILEELINYATYHFAAEERLMAQHDYCGLDEHLKQHADFIEQVKSNQQDFQDGRKTLSLELIVLLKDWTLEHILKCDQEYVGVIGPKLQEDQLRGVALSLA